MFGVNIFFDYDFFCDYVCVGFGGEYWCDFFKFFVNVYVGLIGWKIFLDVEDYEECLVSGWDLCVEGYLLLYLQFGVKMVYEQYYGNEVGLFGKDEWQKNLYVLIVGVSWILVLLLKFSVEQCVGKVGEYDICFGVEVSYCIGDSLCSQLDLDVVGFCVVWWVVVMI